MNVSNRCWNVLLKEANQHGVFINENSCPVTYTTLNLESSEHRIHYLFRYSPYHILLSKTSITDFATKVPGALEVLNTLCSINNLNICSVSSGLGEDLIGFLCALKELKLMQEGSISAGFVNNNNECHQTSKNLFDAHINFFQCNSWKYIQCDSLTTWTPEAEKYLAETDAVFLSFPIVKCINKSSIFRKFMQGLFQTLKSGAVVFCLFQKKQDEFFRSKDFNGKVLNDPLEIQVSNVPYDDLILEIVGKVPVSTGSCYLTVWQKDSTIHVPSNLPNTEKRELNTIKDHQSLPPNLLGSEFSTSETNTNILNPNTSNDLRLSETSLTSLVDSLEYLDMVLRKFKTLPDSSNSHPETNCLSVEINYLMNALLTLEESLKKLFSILHKCPISALRSQQVTKDYSVFTPVSDQYDMTSNPIDSTSLLIQSLNNLIDKLEVLAH